MKSLLAIPVVVCLLAAPLSATPAPASNGPVPFVFSTPSDEMDFNIQPVPPAQFKGNPPPAQNVPQSPSNMAPPSPFVPSPPPAIAAVPPVPSLPNDSDEVPFDQFFSTTTVLEPEPEPVAPVADQEEEATPTPTKKAAKRIVRPRFLRAGPTFKEFHSVRLPEPIYSKSYDRPNIGLPIATWEQDRQGMLALAASRGNTEELRALVRDGADMKAPTSGGESLVVLATRYGQANTVRWLLQHGADANTADAGGLTALHYAAYRNDHVVTNLLLQYGGDYTATNPSGITPLRIAETKGATSVGDVLRRAGATS